MHNHRRLYVLHQKMHLDYLKDRRENIDQQFDILGWKGERIKAVKLKNGLLGCGMSHLKCIKLAKKRELDMILICEDDIFFTDPILFKKQLTTFLSSDISWDVAIIAGNNMPPYEKHSDYCIKVSHCQTTKTRWILFNVFHGFTKFSTVAPSFERSTKFFHG